MGTNAGDSIRGLWIFFATVEGNRRFDERGGDVFVARAVEYLATCGGSCESVMPVALTLY